MYHERLARQFLLVIPKGKWPRGCPRTTWNDYISNLDWSNDCEVFRAILAHEAPQRQSRYENERMKSQINNSLHTPYCRIFFFLSHRLAQKVPFDNNTPCNELQIKREPKISTFADHLIPEYPPFKFSALPLFSLRVGVKTLYSTMNLSQWISYC